MNIIAKNSEILRDKLTLVATNLDHTIHQSLEATQGTVYISTKTKELMKLILDITELSNNNLKFAAKTMSDMEKVINSLKTIESSIKEFKI
jgi:virulence-associated protein VapD